MSGTPPVVIIGAGVGGLTLALLLRAARYLR
jgi:2-polyprenyl-6-methoxyphenol hydroxylase-like FAD-dependent oxidoreductase